MLPGEANAISGNNKGATSRSRSDSGRFQFIYRTPCLIDGLVCVGVPSGIGIGDGDAAAALAGDFIGRGSLGLRIEQGIRTVGIAMRPAIDRDRHNVAPRLKSTRTQHAVKLVGNSRLVFRERRTQQQLPSQTKLLDIRETPI